MSNGFGVPGDYDIKDELKMRKILESNSSWQFEFSKNPDPYGEDMEFYKWDFDPVDGYTPTHYGYIELERADKWTIDSSQSLEPGPIDPREILPENWAWGDDDTPIITFLKRKVFRYNHEKQRFTDEPKENYQRTVLLKFDNSIQECFSVPLIAIKRDGRPTPRSKNEEYNDAYLALRADHEDIYIGLNNVMQFIDGFMKYQQDPQTRLDLEDFTQGGLAHE